VSSQAQAKGARRENPAPSAGRDGDDGSCLELIVTPMAELVRGQRAAQPAGCSLWSCGSLVWTSARRPEAASLNDQCRGRTPELRAASCGALCTGKNLLEWPVAKEINPPMADCTPDAILRDPQVEHLESLGQKDIIPRQMIPPDIHMDVEIAGTPLGSELSP